MKTIILTLASSCLLAQFAATQQALLFTGRFPFVNRDVVNNGGSIPQMTEFDFSYAVPLPGASFAGTLMPATAMQCYLGDGDNDGNFLKLRNWKPSAFSSIGINGVFVKDADQGNVTWDKVYWTPRLNATLPPMEVLTNNGTPVTLVDGDWVRFLPNGNVEFFMTQAQYAVAAGAQNGAGIVAASALVQTSNGDLFYTSAVTGHWVNGNQSPGQYAQDGAILKIDAANITYDANGNVASFAPDSARLLINETLGGPGSTLTVRQMVDNAGCYDRTGMPLATAGVYAETCGLGLDPNGGTWIPGHPDATGAYPPEPNLVWCSNAGSYAGTIWSTNNSGEVAVINSTLCGSTTPGVPADGSWLGVNLDIANFQPTLLGMTVIGLPQTGLIADQADYGSLADNVSQPSWDMDFYGTPNMAVVSFVAAGPQSPSVVVPSLSINLLPLGFDAMSWPELFLTTSPISAGAALTDNFGYATISTPNPNTGAFSGFTVTVQGLGLAPGGFQLSSPVIVQLQ